MLQRLEQVAYQSTTTVGRKMANRPDITLYTTATPNGLKISAALEELGLVG